MQIQVLTIAKLRENGEGYLIDAVARGSEDYYSGAGEAVGQWLGGGALDLALLGEVDPEHFRHVLRGEDPFTGELLADRKVQGFDLTFSSPKSVGLLYGLDAETASIVSECHDQAVAAAIGYIERQSALVRLHDNGVRTEVDSTGYVAAAFRHRTSRAGDPQLHSHVVVANLAHAEGDDRWRALTLHTAIFKHARTAGHLYQAELRSALTARLGVAWEPIVNGCSEIQGIDPALRKLFSKRTQEVEKYAIEHGESPRDMKATSIASLATRRAKPGHREPVSWSKAAGSYGVEPADAGTLRGRWAAETKAAGLELDVMDVLGKVTEPIIPDLEAVSAQLASPDGLTEHRPSFSRRDVIIAFASQPGVDAVRAIEAADEFLGRPDLVPLSGRHPGAEIRWTTEELLRAESSVLGAASRRAGDGVGVVDAEAAIAARPTLSEEQQAMVRELTSSGRGLEIVVGRAGTGKTYALSAAREAFEDAGLPVVGCALSAAAAGELSRGGGLVATTIARQIADLWQGGLEPGTVCIVDEASMADSRSLAKLNRAVERCGGKLVLVGDDKQLSAVSAGGLFARLVQTMPFHAELTEVRRQSSEADRDALAAIRDGDHAAGMKGLLRGERTVIAPDAAGQQRAMVSDYMAARAEGKSVLVLARQRRRVEDLACAVRSARKAAGELGSEELTVQIEPEKTGSKRAEFNPPSRVFARGDEVLFKKNLTGNWRHLATQMTGVYNGARGTVESVEPATGLLSVRLEADPAERAVWDAGRARLTAEIDQLTAELETAEPGPERTQLERRLAARTEVWASGKAPVKGQSSMGEPGSVVIVDPDYLRAGYVHYSYARSVHSAQGATADCVIADGMDLRGREASYVALSRHREDVKAYLVAHPEPVDIERHQAVDVGPETPLSGLLERTRAREATRIATSREAIESRRRVRELADRPLSDLRSERERLEAKIARTKRAPKPADALDQARLSTSRVDAKGFGGEHTATLLQIAELRQAETLRAGREAELLAAEDSAEHGPCPPSGAARKRWISAVAESLLHPERVEEIEPEERSA